nr:hypothetical protein CFP56_53406 [Quercus suber]
MDIACAWDRSTGLHFGPAEGEEIMGWSTHGVVSFCVCVICYGKVGGSISGWAVVCFQISGSVTDVGGAGIGMIGVIGAMDFVATKVPATIGDGVGRGGRGGPLGCLGCGMGLSVAILGC